MRPPASSSLVTTAVPTRVALNVPNARHALGPTGTSVRKEDVGHEVQFKQPTTVQLQCPKLVGLRLASLTSPFRSLPVAPPASPDKP